MLGPSGAGKTTHAAPDRGGSKVPTAATLLIDGEIATRASVRARRRVHLPAVFAVSAPERVPTTSRFRCARRAAASEADVRACASRPSPRCCTWKRSSATWRRNCRAARCSAPRSAARRRARAARVFDGRAAVPSLDAKLREELRVELKQALHRTTGARRSSTTSTTSGGDHAR